MYGSPLEDQRQTKDRDIFVDDLSATLEAHRSRNRASVIRKIEASPSLFIKRPVLNDGAQGDENVKVERQEGSESSHGSDDAQKLSSTTKSKKWRMKRNTNDRRTRPENTNPDQPKDAQKSVRRKGQDLKAEKIRGRETHKSSTDFQEYKAEYLYPKPPWDEYRSRTQELQRPWLLYIDPKTATHSDRFVKTLLYTKQTDKYCRLSTEIKAFEKYMEKTPSEDTASQLAVSAIDNIIQQKMPTRSLTLLGSRMTGLATPMSDIDLSLSSLSPSDDDRSENMSTRQVAKEAEQSLKVIQKLLRSSPLFAKPELVHARVPIVHSKHVGTGIEIQVQALAPHQAAQDCVRSYLAKLPSLRPLYIVLRHSLRIRNLTTVYEGGLGSYTIFMMIVAALKHASGQFAADDLGGQLIHVLQFYAKADLYKHGFSVDPPRVFDKASSTRSMEEQEARSHDSQLAGIDHILQRQNLEKPYLLTLQDPVNEYNDLGKNGYMIKNIQATWSHALQGLSKAVATELANPNSTGESNTSSRLDYLLKADYKPFEMARRKLQRYGDPSQHRSLKNHSTIAITQGLLDRVKPSPEVYKKPPRLSIRKQTATFVHSSTSKEVAIIRDLHDTVKSGPNIYQEAPRLTFRKYTVGSEHFMASNEARRSTTATPKIQGFSEIAAHEKAQLETLAFRSAMPVNDSTTFDGNEPANLISVEGDDGRTSNADETLLTEQRGSRAQQQKPAFRKHNTMRSTDRDIRPSRLRGTMRLVLAGDRKSSTDTPGDLEEGGKGF